MTEREEKSDGTDQVLTIGHSNHTLETFLGPAAAEPECSR